MPTQETQKEDVPKPIKQQEWEAVNKVVEEEIFRFGSHAILETPSMKTAYKDGRIKYNQEFIELGQQHDALRNEAKKLIEARQKKDPDAQIIKAAAGGIADKILEASNALSKKMGTEPSVIAHVDMLYKKPELETEPKAKPKPVYDWRDPYRNPPEPKPKSNLAAAQYAGIFIDIYYMTRDPLPPHPQPKADIEMAKEIDETMRRLRQDAWNRAQKKAEPLKAGDPLASPSTPKSVPKTGRDQPIP